MTYFIDYKDFIYNNNKLDLNFIKLILLGIFTTSSLYVFVYLFYNYKYI